MSRLLVDPRNVAHLRMLGSSLILVCFGVGHLIVWFMFVERFTMMYQCTIHRCLFKKRYQTLEVFISWCACPFFGQAFGSFHIHHMAIHHVDDNLQDDLSPTIHHHQVRKGTHFSEPTPGSSTTRRSTMMRMQSCEHIRSAEHLVPVARHQHKNLARHLMRIPNALARTEAEVIGMFRHGSTPIRNWILIAGQLSRHRARMPGN
jgi:hypothetical protein